MWPSGPKEKVSFNIKGVSKLIVENIRCDVQGELLKSPSIDSNSKIYVSIKVFLILLGVGEFNVHGISKLIVRSIRVTFKKNFLDLQA